MMIFFFFFFLLTLEVQPYQLHPNPLLSSFHYHWVVWWISKDILFLFHLLTKYPYGCDDHGLYFYLLSKEHIFLSFHYQSHQTYWPHYYFLPTRVVPQVLFCLYAHVLREERLRKDEKEWWRLRSFITSRYSLLVRSSLFTTSRWVVTFFLFCRFNIS